VLEIIPSTDVDATVQLPGSKYIANRLIPMCALASTASKLTNVVDNDDIQAAIGGLNALGYQLKLDKGCLDIQPRKEALSEAVSLNTAHSGTFSRFVAAVAALESVEVTVNCSEKMATRPMKELFRALSSLGVSIQSNNQKLPAVITGPVTKKNCELDAGRSSQFLSALLIVAPLTEHGLDIRLIGNQVSNSYVDMTCHWMSLMGIDLQQKDKHLIIESGQSYQGISVNVPGDAVSASYFMGLVAVAKGSIRIESFDHNSLQGESKFYQVLEKMGMRFEKGEDYIVAISDSQLKGIEIDMGEMPDVVQTLAVIASFAKGTTKITNIAHLAYKESNRISDTATELIKAGVKVEFGEDYLIIEGGEPRSATIETYDDHRMAMSMALLGAKTEGIRIKDPLVVNKSFPNYWKLMAQCGLNSKILS